MRLDSTSLFEDRESFSDDYNDKLNNEIKALENKMAVTGRYHSGKNCKPLCILLTENIRQILDIVWQKYFHIIKIGATQLM
jgi:hypothetical protein